MVTQLTEDVALTPELRERVAASIRAIGVMPTAKLLGVGISVVTRLAVPGCPVRSGSVAAVLLRADRLPALPPRAEATGT